MRNPLQEQLLKAGLAKKSKIDQIAREQAKQQQAKQNLAKQSQAKQNQAKERQASAAPGSEQAEAERARLEKVELEKIRQEKVERDRSIAAERNAQARAQEHRAQVRQIVENTKLPPEGDIEYRFTHNGAIRSVLVTDAVRRQLSKGVLAIAIHDKSYALIPRAAADKVEARDPTMLALDHGRGKTLPSDDPDDEYYSQFKVPDDLVW